MPLRSIFLFAFLLYATASSQAQTRNCIAMADMAQDIANIRDMGVPLSSVVARLKEDVADEKERALGILAATIVYSGNHSGTALRREILKKCKN